MKRLNSKGKIIIKQTTLKMWLFELGQLVEDEVEVEEEVVVD